MPKVLSDLELPRDPDAPLEAATKQLVDSHTHQNVDADTVDGQHADDLQAHSRRTGLLLGGM